MLRHCARELVKKSTRQIRRRMVRTVGALVTAKKQAPVALFYRGAGLARERHTRLRELFPLLPDLLPLFVRERGKKVREVAVSDVDPMKLHAVARDQSRRFGFTRLIVIQKQHVQRREAAGADLIQRVAKH